MKSILSLRCFAFLTMTALTSTAYAQEPMPVVSSFSILGDIAQHIGGERIKVVNLVGANQDAHAYQLTGNDVKKIISAKLVLLNGLGLEKADVVRAVKQSKVPYAQATEGITPLNTHHDHDEHGHHDDENKHTHHEHADTDPHVWHDPVLMQKYAANITKALIKVDPQGQAYYQQKFQDYSKQLLELDAYARKQFSSIPAKQRKILTGHDSFSYLGKRYGIEFIAPQGVSTETEPSAKEVASIIGQIRQERLKAVFTENIKNSQLIKRITQETGANIGGQLYSDALSKGTPAQSYADLFRYNVHTMSKAMK